jgi:hypothetical protein
MTESLERLLIWVLILGLGTYLQAVWLAYTVFTIRNPSRPTAVTAILALIWPVTAPFFLLRS